MAKKKYEAVATIGEYTNGAGEKKKRYINVGTVFEDDQGRLSLKLDAVPVGQTWSGWVSFFEPSDNRGGQQAPARATNQDALPPGRQQQRTMPPAPASSTDDYATDDEIPF